MCLILLLLPSLVAAEPMTYNNAGYLSVDVMVQDMARDFANALDEALVARDSDNSLQERLKTAPKISWKAAKSWHLSKFGNCIKGKPPMCFARQEHQQQECRRRQGLDPYAKYAEVVLAPGPSSPCADMKMHLCTEERWYCNKLYLGLKQNGSTVWKIASRDEELQTEFNRARKEYPDVIMEIHGDGFGKLEYRVARRAESQPEKESPPPQGKDCALPFCKDKVGETSSAPKIITPQP